MAYADLTHVGHKYEDAAQEEEGKQVELVARKKCTRVVRASLRELHTKQIVRVSAFSGSRLTRRGLGLLSPAKYLTIIPRARMGSESIAHEACFSKIQLVGKKISRQNNFS